MRVYLIREILVKIVRRNYDREDKLKNNEDNMKKDNKVLNEILKENHNGNNIYNKED